MYLLHSRVVHRPNNIVTALFLVISFSWIPEFPV